MTAKTINILLIVTIICISLSAILVRLTDAPSSVLVMYRMLLACVFLTPFVYKYRHAIGRITHKEWLAIAFAGMMLGMHLWLWFMSLNHTTVASSTLILALQPAVALIDGLLIFKERVQLRTLLALGIAFT